jgi:hypothetical protein
VDWPSYLRTVVSKTAGAAAGVAAAAGGPVAIASAASAAERLSDDLLTQFMPAHADQLQQLEEISRELRGRLISLQDSVGALLDGPWRTALAHIEEASRRPLRREQELELARIHLFDAWGPAEALLERNPQSQDPAALRCPLIAQQLAAVYSFLGEPLNATHWLVTAYAASHNQLNSQVDAVSDVFLQKVQGAKKASGQDPWKRPALLIDVRSTDPDSKELLWAHAPGKALSPPYMAGEQWSKTVVAERDLEFEERLVALVDLDAETQLLRQTCIDAGTGQADLPSESARDGARRAVTSVSTQGVSGYAFIIFNASTAIGISVRGNTYVSRGWMAYAEPSPLERRVDPRYKDIWRFTAKYYFPYLHIRRKLSI